MEENIVENNVVDNETNDVAANTEVVSKDLMTNEESVIKGSCFRISVLTERLIRLEYHPNGVLIIMKVL